MKKKNILFFVSVLCLIGLFVVVDSIIGKLGELALSKMPDYAYTQISKDNYRLNRVTKDIVLVGSSRCSRHYVSTMLRDSINTYVGGNYSLFNCGVDGRPVNNNCCVAEAIMNRYKPVLLVFDVSELDLATGVQKGAMEDFGVFYKDNAFVKKYLDDMGWKERVKMSINMFRFNRRLAHIVQSYLNDTNDDGYEPIYQKMAVSFEEGNKPKVMSHSINEKSLENFSRVLKTAQDKGVNLIVVSSPRFRPNDENTFLADLCKGYGIPYIELHDLELFNSHPEFFKDAAHLNDDGAHVFTNLFFQELKYYLRPLM